MYRSFLFFSPGLLATGENVGQSLGVKKKFHSTATRLRAIPLVFSRSSQSQEGS